MHPEKKPISTAPPHPSETTSSPSHAKRMVMMPISVAALEGRSTWMRSTEHDGHGVEAKISRTKLLNAPWVANFVGHGRTADWLPTNEC